MDILNYFKYIANKKNGVKNKMLKQKGSHIFLIKMCSGPKIQRCILTLTVVSIVPCRHTITVIACVTRFLAVTSVRTVPV